MSATAPAPLRPSFVRSETEVAAEAVMCLFGTGLLGTGSRTLIRVAEITHIPMGDLKAAWERNQKYGYRPPTSRSIPADVVQLPDAEAVVAAMPPQVQAATRQRLATKNPSAGKRICSRCREVKDWAEFGLKDRRTGSLKSACRPCTQAYQRDRYLAVSEADACASCDLALVEGDEVEACDVELRHVACGRRAS